eukprot:52400-Ditylum_brightwellii.AAC.1
MSVDKGTCDGEPKILSVNASVLLRDETKHIQAPDTTWLNWSLMELFNNMNDKPFLVIEELREDASRSKITLNVGLSGGKRSKTCTQRWKSME